MWIRLANVNTDSVGADYGPSPFCLAIGVGPPPAPFLCFGVDSYLQDSGMSMGDQIGVEHIDREADWPHILDKRTRFCNVALRVTNMRWGRRCWDCSDVPGYLQKAVWRLRNFCTTQLPSCHTVGSRESEQFAIDMCACMTKEVRGLACKRIVDGGAKGRVQASPGQSRSRSWRWLGGVQRRAVGTVGSCDGL